MTLPECTEEEFNEALKLTGQYAPDMPLGWRPLFFDPRSPLYGLRAYERKGDGLEVLFSAGRWEDGKVWLHVSLAFRRKMPSYQDMCDVKRLFIGADRKALQIFAAESNHVNIHEYALHLWHCIDGDNLPEFGRCGTI